MVESGVVVCLWTKRSFWEMPPLLVALELVGVSRCDGLHGAIVASNFPPQASYPPGAGGSSSSGVVGVCWGGVLFTIVGASG